MDNMPGEYPLMHTNDFELHDFIDEANFDQFIDLIRGENEGHVTGFDCDLINGLLVDNQFGPTPPLGDGFGFNDANMYASAMLPDENYVPITLPDMDGDMKGGDDGNGCEDYSSGTTATTKTSTSRKDKADRSRTLVSERRRRGRMKEKLYALRSLVPNITKMDKASIIGDAISYVQQLQMQAKKLKTEIAGLETSLVGGPNMYNKLNTNPKKTKISSSNNPICKKIIKIDVFQVEERGFYSRVVCNKGEGVAVSLYRALESLTNFIVQTSNLSTYPDKFVLACTLKVKESEQEMNLPNLKLWITGALLNQGFQI